MPITLLWEVLTEKWTVHIVLYELLTVQYEGFQYILLYLQQYLQQSVHLDHSIDE